MNEREWEITLGNAIDLEIDFWQEQRDREPIQTDWIEE